MESAKIIAKLARMLRDVGLAEELAQDALVTALEQWPVSGVPNNPGAWLMVTAKNRALDQLRRFKLLQRKHQTIANDAELLVPTTPSPEEESDKDVGDDLLRLIFIACHPVVVHGSASSAHACACWAASTPAEIARAFLVPEPTIGQRIVRAKRALDRGSRARSRLPRSGGTRSAARICARSDLSDFQRRLRGDRRRGMDAPDADARRRCAWAAFSLNSRLENQKYTG